MRCTNEEIGGALALYEFGLLSGPEKDQFESHMAQCQSCASDVVSMKPVWNTLRHHPDIFDNPERYIKKRFAFLSSFSMKPVFVLATAAVLVLVFGVGYWNQPDTRRLAGMITLEEESGTRSGGASSEFMAGAEAFRARDSDTAKGKFEALSRRDPKSYQAHYYLGLCYLQSADSGFLWWRRTNETSLRHALDALNQAAALAEGSDAGYEARARMGLAKAYLLKDDRAHALEELAKVENLKAPNPDVAELKRVSSALRATMNDER